MSNRKNYANVDITGQQFGRLTAIKRVDNSRSRWHFSCSCGNCVELSISRVLYGQLSCGCMQKENQSRFVESCTKHGQSRTKLYRKYKSMINRCYNPNAQHYERYGGRGITVCEEWLHSFEVFAKWAYDNGYDANKDGRREQSIDRINNNCGYSPDNCKWSTTQEQQKNKNCSTLYEYQGQLYTCSEFADKFNISDKSFVYRRTKQGNSLCDILEEWNKTHNIPDTLIDVSCYATLHNLSGGYVRRLLLNNAIDGVKIGRKWYISIA